MIYDKRPGIPWYVKAILEFKRTHYFHDDETGITTCIKYLFGTTYVVSEITAEEDPA